MAVVDFNVKVLKLKAMLVVCLLSISMQAFSISLQSNASNSIQNEWLIGSWALTFDPDGDPQDVLTFKDSGEFIATEVVSGRMVKGGYAVKTDFVEISIGQSFKMQLRFDEVKDKLYLYSKETNNTSYYTKQK